MSKAQDKKTDSGPVSDQPLLAARPLMYVGPQIRNPVPLQCGAVYPNGLPALLQKAVKGNADLAALFLPLKEAGAALRDLESGRGQLVKHAKAVTAQSAGRAK